MPNHAAYDQGYNAYWDGVDVSDNPFDEDTEADARLAWELGWRKAREHDYDEDD
jgi:ribosome modulation factor